MPGREHSTNELSTYILRKYISPRFGDSPIREVTPLAVTRWFSELKLAPTTKASIRSVLRQCFDLAALHEFIPAIERNPMSLVKLKGTTKRKEKIVQVTMKDFQRLIQALPEPHNIMTLVAADLGCRLCRATRVLRSRSTQQTRRHHAPGGIPDGDGRMGAS